MDLSFNIKLSTKPVVDFFSENALKLQTHLFSGAKVVSAGADKVSDFLFGSAASSFCTVSTMGLLAVAVYNTPKLATWIGAAALSTAVTHAKRSEVSMEDIEEEAFSKLIENHEGFSDIEQLFSDYADEFEVIKQDLKTAKEKDVSPLYDVAQANILAALVLSCLKY